MARHGLPTFKELWNRHEVLYIEIFSLAVIKLLPKNCHSKEEDEISEILSVLLNQVCFQESKKRNYEIRTPDWEKPIQPVVDNELKGGKKRKRPDFTCKLSNPYASRAEEHEISLHVECKRLGYPTSKGWILNENYVTDGIKRFESLPYEYGKRAPSGLMIGYIVSMEPPEIVDEINSHQKQLIPHNPPLQFRFDRPPLFKEIQNLNRKNVTPQNFQLIHLWINLIG